jgi:hypothetical protein
MPGGLPISIGEAVTLGALIAGAALFLVWVIVVSPIVE